MAESKDESGLISPCVWVGNVAPDVSDEALRRMFDSVGQVKLVNRFRHSKCAFVTFAKSASAVESLKLNGQRLGSMHLAINTGKASTHLWVGNVLPSVSAQDLRHLFEQCGPVETIRILKRSRCAFVNFIRTEDAIKARQELDGHMLEGQALILNFKWTETPFVAKAPSEPVPPILPATTSPAAGSKEPAKLVEHKHAVDAWPPTQALPPSPLERQLFVGKLTPNVTVGNLWMVFSQFGVPIDDIKVFDGRGYGFVTFRDAETARRICEWCRKCGATLPWVINYRKERTLPGYHLPA